MEQQVEGPTRTHALLETVRKLLELQHEEEEEIPAAKRASQESTDVQGSPCSEATPVAAVEQIVAVPSNKKRAVQRQGVPGGPCANCGTHESPQWRRPSTKKMVLCNACGIYYSRHNTLPQRSCAINSNKKKTSLAAPPVQMQASQVMNNSMDMGNESAGGEDEAITAAGPTHHMALLQAACAAAAANEGHYTRRPSSHSNTSQTDVIMVSQSSPHSSPSRSSQEDEVMLDAPPAARTKHEDAATRSQSSTQQPAMMITTVPSRKRSLRAGSSSAPAGSPTAGAADPTFSVRPNAPTPQAPAFASHLHPWGAAHPSQLLLLQQQQQLLHMRLLGGALPTQPPNPDLLRILASMQPHPQLLASQRSDPYPALHHHMQQHQHALVLHHVHQMQQHQLHALSGGLTHLSTPSSVFTPHAAGLVGRGTTGSTRSSGNVGLSASLGSGGVGLPAHPLAQQPSASHSRSASREDPLVTSAALPPASAHFQQQVRRPPITTPLPSLPVLPLNPQNVSLVGHGSAQPPLQKQEQQQQEQQQQCGAGGSNGNAKPEGQVTNTSHWLSPSSQQLLQQQPQHSEEEDEVDDAKQEQLLEPAAKRHQRQGSIGSGPEGGTHTAKSGGEGGHAFKMIPSYACRGPRAMSFDATNSAAAQQQQQRLQHQTLLLQQQLASMGPPLAAGGGNGNGTALPTVYRPAPCALSDC